MNHKGLVDVIRISSQPPHISKEGVETLQQQWMSFLTAQYPISLTERAPEIRCFLCNLRVGLGRNGTM